MHALLARARAAPSTPRGGSSDPSPPPNARNTPEMNWCAVEDMEQIRGSEAEFVRCQHAGRRFVVVLAPGTLRAPPADEHVGRGGAAATEKLLTMLERGLRVDRPTAAYYLSACSGSVRAAMAAYGASGGPLVSGSGGGRHRPRLRCAAACPPT